MNELLEKKVDELVKLIPEQDDETLLALHEAETGADKPRKGVVDALNKELEDRGYEDDTGNGDPEETEDEPAAEGLTRMVREDGKTADVHPDMVREYQRGGWSVE